MMTWLNAKNDHVIKYANIYLDKGFDIFNITCTPLQLMFPTWGTQVNKNKNQKKNPQFLDNLFLISITIIAFFKKLPEIHGTK